ncbi:MAG: 2-hydroxyacyl-CoA dehydratase [Desulfobacterales bacterium]|nr:2-hydroxyacyl-CoA dehydratase [Desulfobacterales bacterium]
MEKLDLFYEISNNPFTYGKKWKEQNEKKVISFVCSYTPEEIIYAAKALPLRIIPNTENLSLSNAHFQSYSCRFVRGVLEELLSGKLNFIDGIVFPHTCDSIQRLSDIWRINADIGFHIDLVLPVKLNTDSAKEYMEASIRKFRIDIENKLNIKITDEDLHNAVCKYNKIRKALKTIYEIRRDKYGLLTSSDVYSILSASMVMDRDLLLQKLLEIIDTLKNKEQKETNNKRLILSGGMCNVPNIYKIIENSGGTIVWDDLCTGARYFEKIIDEIKEPISAIAESYINRINCPAKHSSIYSRGNNLIDLVNKNRADGVIFIFLKFCDPHSFDYPYLKKMLDQNGVPNIIFEIEDPSKFDGQFETRCQAFLEMLQ